MNRLFLFNPENDIALGNNLRQFTPPRQAALLHRAGAAIPFWLGDKDDRFIVGKDDMPPTLQWIDRLGIEGPRPIVNVDRDCELSPTPWGWSRDAVSQFRKAGMPENCLDGVLGKIDVYRELSHRRSSLKLLQLLQAQGMDVPDSMPIEASSLGVVENYINDNGNVYLKSPWSSSGRGVFPADASSWGRLSPALNGIIRTQGSVMVERALDKVCDFAMLFLMDNGKARFYGLSLFVNSTAVNYGGNFVGSDSDIKQWLAKYCPIKQIEELQSTLGQCLEQLTGGNYDGPLGVDMLLYRDENDEIRIDPAVELNLRYTMGFVARGVYNHLHKTGWMRMTPGKSGPQDALRLIPENPHFSLCFEESGENE